MSVVGTVIQRSFIGSDCSSIINIASAPVYEMGFSDNDELRDIVGSIVGVPSSTILGQDDYKDIRDIIAGNLREISDKNNSSVYERNIENLENENIFQLAHDYIGLASGKMPELDLVSSLHYSENLIRFNDEQWIAALRCMSLRQNPQMDLVRFTFDIFDYEIPLAQSPQVRGDSLLNLLNSTKKICVAPLIGGGTIAMGQLGQGNYVAALLTTSASGVMTLILIGTVSVGSLLVQRVAQARNTSVEKSSRVRVKRRKEAGG